MMMLSAPYVAHNTPESQRVRRKHGLAVKDIADNGFTTNALDINACQQEKRSLYAAAARSNT